jgi:alpha-galactosidase
MNRGATVMGVWVMMATLRWADAASPTPEEMAKARRWVAATFEALPPPKPVAAGLVVVANHDIVVRNQHGGKPLTIAGAPYKRGLYCHALSSVVVRLPGPGKSLKAVVGVDSNDQTRPGRGSIVFSVKVGGKEAFRTPVLREGMAGVTVAVDLGGATELTLDVGDAGDGIACDQADWAETHVLLADGQTVWLGDLPFLGPADGSPSPVAGPPFSFVYGGQPSALLLPWWGPTRATRELDGQRVEHTLTYADPKTKLVLRCVVVEYRDFPTVEWTLHFKNAGVADTPILEDIQAIDARLTRGEQGEFTLHYHVGSQSAANDFQPLEAPLPPSSQKRIATSGGRPTNSHLPYFNVEWPGEGVIVVLGWPGQWAAQFDRDGARGLRVRGGQELTHFKLHPGEKVRTPLAVLQFWTGDRLRSQNAWRRWMLAHNQPRPGGKPLPPALIMACEDHFPGMMCDEAGELTFVEAYAKAGIPLDYWWMDAGWYPCDGVGWPKVGTWQPDPKRFPRGIRAVADRVHALGWKLIVWFEPERVAAGTWLAENRPEWVLGGKGGGLLNLGNPDARQWLTDHVDKLLTEQGIDLYRQDFNMDPLGHWRGNDPPDRQGMTEIRHVEGYLAYWDELRRRHPAMPIDTCASGGRRLDLETLRRSVPLLRSDYRFEPVGTQGHTYGMSFWFPYYGTGVGNESAYVVRSHFCPTFGIGGDVRKGDTDWEKMKRRMAEWRKVVPCFFGDYYPLTPYSLGQDVWMAWQFDRPGEGEGMVQAFRRAESPYEVARFRLHGLDPAAHYTLVNFDVPGTTTVPGRELMERGLLVTLMERPSAAVITYQRRTEPR